jgi:hypothetical protein
MQYRSRGITNVDTDSRYDAMEQKVIAQLAYQYWEQRGRPFGSPEEDWFRAEREIRSRSGWTLTPSATGGR